MTALRSQVQWFGPVPNGWSVKAIKHGFSLIGSGTTPPSGEARYYGGTIPWVNTSELRENVITECVSFVTEEALRDFSALRVYSAGTVLFAMYGATIGRVAILGLPATVNQAVCALADPTIFEPRFVFYCLQASRDALNAIASGGGQPNLNAEKVREHRIPCPNIGQQRAIAGFLDREAARLDALVSAKQLLLDLLAEKRKAIIATAVTRGPDPEVKLRDSGVPWLGEIPARWELIPLRYLVSFVSGGTPDKSNAEFWSGGAIPWVSPKDMKVEVISDSEDHITESAICESATQMVPVGSVLVVVRGMILAHTLPVAVTSGPVTINQDIKALICGQRLLPQFLRVVLAGQSSLLLSLADSSAHGTKKLETEVLQRLEVPLPAIGEQHAIVEHIQRETAKLDAVRDTTERTIVLLKERRAALIAAAVTGQLVVEAAA